MTRIWPAVCVVALIASSASSQVIQEGVHTEVTGPSDMCGISGINALAIREKLRSEPSISEKASGSSRFETYFSTVPRQHLWHRFEVVI
jgi:hypothetical protein